MLEVRPDCGERKGGALGCLPLLGTPCAEPRLVVAADGAFAGPSASSRPARRAWGVTLRLVSVYILLGKDYSGL